MKVTIIGRGRGWQDAPDTGERWGITQTILVKPVTLTIDMNVYDDNRWGEFESEASKLTIRKCEDLGIPYIGLHNYPLEEIIRFFDTDYFSSTFDYAVALAMYRGYDEIDIYGAVLAVESEYHYQKPGLDFWVGMAKGRGVEITVHEPTTVLKTRDGKLYGYDDLDGGGVTLKLFKSRRSHMKKIDLKPYFVEGSNEAGPYNIHESVIAVLFNQDQKLSAVDLLKRDDLARKVRNAGDFILLEDSEFDMLKSSFDMIRGFHQNDVEFVKRILNAETVEVAEVQK